MFGISFQGFEISSQKDQLYGPLNLKFSGWFEKNIINWSGWYLLLTFCWSYYAQIHITFSKNVDGFRILQELIFFIS